MGAVDSQLIQRFLSFRSCRFMPIDLLNRPDIPKLVIAIP
jgi:hypothetical protein